MNEVLQLKSVKWDPRTRIILAVCLSALALIIDHAVGLFVIFVVTVVLDLVLRKGGTIVNKKRILQAGVFFVFVTILQSVFHSNRGDSLVLLFGRPFLTEEGLYLGVLFLLRLLIIMFSALIIASEDSRYVIQGLVKFKLPYELAFMTILAIRFIPLFAEEFNKSMTSIQLRGLDLKKIPFRKSIQVYSYLLMPVLANMFVRAKEMALAMEMRCFRAYRQRSSYVRLRFHGNDYVMIFLALSLTAAGIICTAI